MKKKPAKTPKKPAATRKYYVGANLSKAAHDALMAEKRISHRSKGAEVEVMILEAAAMRKEIRSQLPV